MRPGSVLFRPANLPFKYPEKPDADQGQIIRTAVVYGGVGYNAQLESFRGGAQLVIGNNPDES